MRSRVKPELLPILTETVDGTVLDLPTLTDTVEDKVDALTPELPLSDEQCQHLAAQLFPRLERTLRDSLATLSKTEWQTAIRQLETKLPELIRDTVHQPR
jgi:hypothetical protein